ncbi:hypothetical protein LG311_11420 [Sutcliffiella horikoshii]|uniref:S16 family serine protease n=1 Tax=Sutcliffiella horikoshii TaxID=79883 RepID=UPI00384E2D1F
MHFKNNHYLTPFLGTCYIYLNFLYLYLFNYLSGLEYVLLLTLLMVGNSFYIGLAINIRPVCRSFIFSCVFIVLLVLYESPLPFMDKSKTVNYLYFPTEEVVKNSGIYIISVLEVHLSENGEILMNNEGELFQVIHIDNFLRYKSKNNLIYEFVHIVKNQDVEMAENLKGYLKGTKKEIKDYLARDDVSGASSGLALALSSLTMDYGWNNTLSIAVTGAIDKKGYVLGIGLVREKIITAARDGHSHVIVPEVNLEEALEAKEELGLSIVVYGVKSVEEALGVIEDWNGY